MLLMALGYLLHLFFFLFFFETNEISLFRCQKKYTKAAMTHYKTTEKLSWMDLMEPHNTTKAMHPKRDQLSQH